MKHHTLVVTVGLAVACAPALQTRNVGPYLASADSAEYAALRGSGMLELAGQALLTTASGGVKFASGRLVTLDPATSYAREWFRLSGAEVRHFDEPAPEPLFRAGRRLTVADEQGRFWFGRLRPGTYLVRSTVADSATVDSVTVIAALVTVQDSGMNELVLHRAYTPRSAMTLGVEIVDHEQLPGRRFLVIARVSGVACGPGSSDTAPAETAARADLIDKAARRGADAVTGVVCRKKGLSLAQNCMSRIVCEGDAIGWM